jgi:hypothetical protein
MVNEGPSQWGEVAPEYPDPYDSRERSREREEEGKKIRDSLRTKRIKEFVAKNSVSGKFFKHPDFPELGDIPVKMIIDINPIPPRDMTLAVGQWEFRGQKCWVELNPEWKRDKMPQNTVSSSRKPDTPIKTEKDNKFSKVRFLNIFLPGIVLVFLLYLVIMILYE